MAPGCQRERPGEHRGDRSIEVVAFIHSLRSYIRCVHTPAGRARAATPPPMLYPKCPPSAPPSPAMVKPANARALDVESGGVFSGSFERLRYDAANKPSATPLVLAWKRPTRLCLLVSVDHVAHPVTSAVGAVSTPAPMSRRAASGAPGAGGSPARSRWWDRAGCGRSRLPRRPGAPARAGLRVRRRFRAR